MEYLNNHNNIYIVGELNEFKDQNIKEIRKFLRSNRTGSGTRFSSLKEGKDIKHIGINISYMHLLDIGYYGLRSTNHNVKFVYLYRENLLEAYLSDLIAKSIKIWHSYDECQPECKVKFDYDDYKTYFRRQKRSLLRISEKIGRDELKKMLFISYETICKSQESANKLMDIAFGCRCDDFNIRFKKINTDHMSLVENKEDINLNDPIYASWNLQQRIDSVIKCAPEKWKNKLKVIDLDKQEIR
jgi:hypothetical protein